jgi:hypothetical protein
MRYCIDQLTKSFFVVTQRRLRPHHIGNVTALNKNSRDGTVDVSNRLENKIDKSFFKWGTDRPLQHD